MSNEARREALIGFFAGLVIGIVLMRLHLLDWLWVPFK